MKYTSYLLNLIFLVAIVFLFEKTPEPRGLKDFKFVYRPPEFTVNEKESIKKLNPIIIQKVPINYFIYSVKRKDGFISVYLLPLEALQTGVDTVNGRGLLMYDGGVSLKFDSLFKLVEVKNDG